jgi:hypothetical protein
MKTLKLTLEKAPFEVMVTGEKKHEFREDKQWIRTRLFTANGTRKHYDAIQFTNGYGKDRPYFIARMGSVRTWQGEPIQNVFSNGLKVPIKVGMFVIGVGEIIEKGNLNA